MNTNIYEISPNELQKVFPQAYYARYANHLKILQFQKLMLQDEGDKARFHPPTKLGKRNRARSSMPKQQQNKTKMSHYDTFQDTILKNKQELKRFLSFNTLLQRKLKSGPWRQNLIRSVPKNDHQPAASLLLQMKAIEDMEFQLREKANREIRIELEKKSICKFVNKCKSARSASKPALNSSVDDPEKRTKTHRLALKLSEIAMQSLEKNQSISQNRQKAVSRDASYINNINTAMKKSQIILKKAGISDLEEERVLQMLKSRTNSKTSCGFRCEDKKRSLIEETKRIRDETKSMVTLKRYDVILEKRAADKDLERQ